MEGPPPALRDGEIQVFRVDLRRAGAEELIAGAARLLSEDERERAGRTRAGGPRDEFVAGRGCLRRLLGRAIGCDPRGLVVAVGAQGKPELAAIPGIQNPCFNVGNSKDMILIAISRAGTVGVDVERVDASIDLMDVARAAFHPADVARIEGVANDEARLAEFYSCWTRKEAVAKADGRGLTLAPEMFATGGSGEGEREVAVQGGNRFFVREIGVGSTHRAALATARPGAVVGLFEVGVWER